MIVSAITNYERVSIDDDFAVLPLQGKTVIVWYEVFPADTTTNYPGGVCVYSVVDLEGNEWYHTLSDLGWVDTITNEIRDDYLD